MRKKIIILATAGILLFVTSSLALAEQQETSLRTLKFFSEFLKEIWQRVLKLFQKLWYWLKSIWNFYIYPFFNNIWLRAKIFFLGEIEKRKGIIKEEFQEEKKEMKKEEIKMKKEIKEEILPKTTKFFWEKFKAIIK